MLSRMLGVAVICAVSAVAPATAARTVSHSAYARMLQQADAKVARVEAPIKRAMTSKATTVAEIRKLMLASGAVSVALGHEFAAVLPPEPAAQKAGLALSRGELDLGTETRALAHRLPATKTAALAFLQRQHPKGGPEVDRALAALKAAGYHTGS